MHSAEVDTSVRTNKRRACWFSVASLEVVRNETFRKTPRTNRARRTWFMAIHAYVRSQPQCLMCGRCHQKYLHHSWCSKILPQQKQVAWDNMRCAHTAARNLKGALQEESWSVNADQQYNEACNERSGPGSKSKLKSDHKITRAVPIFRLYHRDKDWVPNTTEQLTFKKHVAISVSATV